MQKYKQFTDSPIMRLQSYLIILAVLDVIERKMNKFSYFVEDFHNLTMEVHFPLTPNVLSRLLLFDFYVSYFIE